MSECIGSYEARIRRFTEQQIFVFLFSKIMNVCKDEKSLFEVVGLNRI